MKFQKGHIGFWNGKKMSEEHKIKISQGCKGKSKPPRSKLYRMNMSKAKKGKSTTKKGRTYPHLQGVPHYGRRGQPAWNKGLKTGIIPKTAFKKGVKPWNTGKKGIIRAWNKGIYGENSHAWKGGISFEPYSSLFNQQLKDKIRVRDNFICQLCRVPELELNRRLCVHHMDYNKKNCNTKNLISLCNPCNAKVNFNRNYWQNYFQNLIITMEAQWRCKEIV